MQEFEPVDLDIVIDIILDILDIVWNREIPPVTDIGDLPFTVAYLEERIKNPEVREVVVRRVREAQAQGHEFPLPSGPELAAARERQLARRQRDS
jgi:hypothetical protein